MGVNEKDSESVSATGVGAPLSDRIDAGICHEVTFNKSLDRAYGKLAFGKLSAIDTGN